MALTQADFNRIWASTSPLTPYNFSNTNYLQGWNFVGSTPPARQMWDKYMNLADQKMQYLYNNYLPLAGGVMTGWLSANADEFRILNSKAEHDGMVSVFGGSGTATGANLSLYGTSHSSQAGRFVLSATDGANTKSLRGQADGTLTWNNKDVERVNASGSNYIRYESGLQLCWGIVGGGTSFTVTYPVAFNAEPSIATSSDSNVTIGVNVSGRQNTGFVATLSASSYMRYIAIGKWK